MNMGLMFGFLIPLICLRRKYPWNFWLLCGFTVSMAYLVAVTVTFFSVIVVLQAMALTIGIFMALTLFTIVSKQDFSGCGPILYAMLTMIILGSFIQMILAWGFGIYSSAADIAICFATAFVFSMYIIFDTFMIFNRMDPEEYIVAAVELYMDIINLFLALLRILGHFQNSSSS